MFGILMPKRRWPIGLDIGRDSIKMLQLGQASGQVVVRAGGRWRFPESSVNNPIRRRELLVGAVREMLRRGNFQGNRVVTALSCNELSIKNVRVPHMPANELAQAIEWEAKERFGFEVGPNQLNYLQAGSVRQGSETRDEIIMMAVPPEVVEDHLALLDEVGVVPAAIDAELLALFRTFERFLR